MWFSIAVVNIQRVIIIFLMAIWWTNFAWVYSWAPCSVSWPWECQSSADLSRQWAPWHRPQRVSESALETRQSWAPGAGRKSGRKPHFDQENHRCFVETNLPSPIWQGLYESTGERQWQAHGFQIETVEKGMLFYSCILWLVPYEYLSWVAKDWVIIVTKSKVWAKVPSECCGASPMGSEASSRVELDTKCGQKLAERRFPLILKSEAAFKEQRMYHFKSNKTPLFTSICQIDQEDLIYTDLCQMSKCGFRNFPQ